MYNHEKIINGSFGSSSIFRSNCTKKTDNYLSVTLVKVEGLKQALREESLTFDLPNMPEKAIAKTKNLDYSTNNNFVWNGTFSKGEAFIIHENGRTYGHIRNNGAVFDIQYLENGYAVLIQYNMQKLNQIDCAIIDKQNEKSNSKSSQIKKSDDYSKEITIGKSSSSSPIVRALVLYTPAAQATGMNMTDLANTARNQWLNAQINSNVQSNLEIAGVQELNFNETPNLYEDVTNLRDDITAQQLRDQFEADIVLLFTNGNYSYVGVVAAIGPIENDAYAIVQVANATSTVTFSHEAAHLFGARHQFAKDNYPSDAHGHGWQKGIWPLLSKYGSIMRTRELGRDRVLYFSNPYVAHEGEATGVLGTSFNAKLLNVNGYIVEDFRFTQLNFTAFWPRFS